MGQPLVMAFLRCRVIPSRKKSRELDSPGFGETVGFDLEDGTEHRESLAQLPVLDQVLKERPASSTGH